VVLTKNKKSRIYLIGFEILMNRYYYNLLKTKYFESFRAIVYIIDIVILITE